MESQFILPSLAIVFIHYLGYRIKENLGHEVYRTGKFNYFALKFSYPPIDDLFDEALAVVVRATRRDDFQLLPHNAG